jgi:hypothetical protein
MSPPKRSDRDIELTSALRQAGRYCQAGKPYNAAELYRLIEARREHSPVICAALTDLIYEALDADARGDRDAAVEHFREAIHLSSHRPPE